MVLSSSFCDGKEMVLSSSFVSEDESGDTESFADNFLFFDDGLSSELGGELSEEVPDLSLSDVLRFALFCGGVLVALETP